MANEEIISGLYRGDSKAIKEAIEVLSNPDKDCISRAEALSVFKPRGINDEVWKECDTYKKIASLPSIQPKSEWIPVSEGLPEIHNYMQEYIVTIKGNFIRTAFFTESNGKSWWSIDNVIAWMPLPKPYKLADSEKE